MNQLKSAAKKFTRA